MSEPGANRPSANAITVGILLAVSEQMPECVLWRQNAGMGLPLAYVKMAIGCLKRGDIAGALRALAMRPFRAGVTGTADISGIATIGPLGIRVEIEVKTGGDKLQADQVFFRDMILKHGGVWVLAVSVEQTVADLRAVLEQKRLLLSGS